MRLTRRTALLAAGAAALPAEQALAATAAAAATRRSIRLVLEVERRGVSEVRHFNDQVADVVHAGDHVFRQVLGR